MISPGRCRTLATIAPGHRYAAMRNENQRISAETSERLERKVAQRTREVRSALTQLEQVHDRLRDSSRRDGLSGLYNRAWFHEGCTRMFDRAKTHAPPLALLMIDLDHFKSINDRHGHLVGDARLRAAARCIGRSLHPHDALLARFGGEEFVVTLPDTEADDAARIADAVRVALNDAGCHADDPGIAVTAGIGVFARVPATGDSVDCMIAATDRALYAAKAEGRDCVRVAP